MDRTRGLYTEDFNSGESDTTEPLSICNMMEFGKSVAPPITVACSLMVNTMRILNADTPLFYLVAASSSQSLSLLCAHNGSVVFPEPHISGPGNPHPERSAMIDFEHREEDIRILEFLFHPVSHGTVVPRPVASSPIRERGPVTQWYRFQNQIQKFISKQLRSALQFGCLFKLETEELVRRTSGGPKERLDVRVNLLNLNIFQKTETHHLLITRLLNSPNPISVRNENLSRTFTVQIRQWCRQNSLRTLNLPSPAGSMNQVQVFGSKGSVTSYMKSKISAVKVKLERALY